MIVYLLDSKHLLLSLAKAHMPSDWDGKQAAGGSGDYYLVVCCNLFLRQSLLLCRNSGAVISIFTMKK